MPISSSIVLGIDIDAGDADEMLKSLEKKLGVVIDRSQGMEAALVDATKQLREQEGAAKKLRDALHEAVTGEAALAASAKDAEKALKAQEKAATDLTNTQAKATELFRKGVGGGEMAEKARDIAKGLEIWSKESNDVDTRNKALAGSMGIAARVALGYAGQIMAIVQAANAAALAEDEHRRRVVALGSSLAAFQAGTMGAADSTDAFAMRQSALSHRLQTTDGELRILTRAAREYALANGGTVREAFEQLTAAIESGDTRALQRFNVTLGATSSGMVSLAQVTDALSTSQQTHGAPATVTLAEAQARLTHENERLHNSLLSMLSFQPNLEQVAAHMQREAEENSAGIAKETEKLHQKGHELVDVSHAHELLTEKMRLGGEAARALKTEHDDASEAVKRLRRATQDLSMELRDGELPVDRMARRLRGIANAIADARVVRQENRGIRSQLRSQRRAGTINSADEAAGLSAAGISGGGGGFSANDRDEMNRAITELERQMAEQHVRFDRMHGKQHETVQHFLQREQAEMRRAMEVRTQMLGELDRALAAMTAHGTDADRVAARAANDNDIEELSAGVPGSPKTGSWRTNNAGRDQNKEQIQSDKSALDAKQQAHNARMQMSSAWRESLHADQTAEQGYAAASVEAWGAVKGAFKQHLTAVIEGKESMGEALQGMLSDVLLEIATSSAVKALEAQAAAIFAAAAEDYPGAAKFEAAAVGYAAVAAAAGVGAGIMIQSKGSSSGGGGRAPSQVSRAGAANDNAGGGVTYINNFNGAIYDRAGMRGVVREANEANRDRGTQSAYERRAVSSGR